MEPERIAVLENPAVFPEHPREIEILQTHLSVVCLSGEFAYKFKKSIELPFADFTSLEKRQFYCEEEFRLNRRLCPDTYLSVVRLVETGGEERFRIEEKDEETPGKDENARVRDYAVRMRRLPAERMMDVLLDEDGVDEAHVREIAERVCRFHRETGRSEQAEELGDPERLREFALANFEETDFCCGDIFPESLHRALRERAEEDFERHLPTMRDRLRRGLVVEGHGDLHARNICLTEPVAIYDCIEFEPALRCADVATEHAFLVMDLRFRGHPELADAYRRAVIESSGDKEMETLLPMLIRYRAMVRAKVAALTASESELSDEEREKASAEASCYLRFVAGIGTEERGPTWLVLAGLPGSGKSTVAARLSELLGWPVVSSDPVRKELAGRETAETLPSDFYTEAFSDRVYAAVADRAGEQVREGLPVVVIDANFRERRRREEIRERALRADAGLVLVWLEIDTETAEKRLAGRAAEGGADSDADVAVFRELVRSGEEPVADDSPTVLRIDASGTPEEVVDRILTGLTAEAESG